MAHFTQSIQASSSTYASNFPRTLLIASEKDPLYTETIGLARAMQEAGVSYKVLLLGSKKYPHARHGFQSFLRGNAGAKAFSDLLNFVKD